MADHVIPFKGEATVYLFRTVLFLNDESAYPRLHIFGKTYSMWPLLHPFLVLALGEVIVVLVMATAIAVPL